MARSNDVILRVIADNKASKPLLKIADDAGEAAEAFYDLNGRLRDAKGRFIGAGKAADDASGSVKKSGKSAEKQARQMETSRAAMVGWAAAAAAAATAAAYVGVRFGKSVIDASASMETYEAQLSILLKSTDLAQERLQRLFEIGSTTPFELAALVEADTIMTSFGLNAETMRGGIMDLAGALGGTLPEASMAVSKAFAAGAGAADVLKERYALLYQDIKRRAAEMGDPSDIRIWQAAMIEALTAVDGVVAGGTEKLAGTFAGAMSNLADQWFKFKKQIGDAGLFDYAKIGLGELLEGLNSAEGDIASLSSMISTMLVDSLDGAIRVFSVLGQVIIAGAGGFKTMARAVEDIDLALMEASRSYQELALAQARFFGDETMIEIHRKELERLNVEIGANEASLRKYNREMEAMTKSFFALGEVGTHLDNVRMKLDEVAEAAGNIPGTITIRAGVVYSVTDGKETAVGSAGTRPGAAGYGVYAPDVGTPGIGEGFGVLGGPGAAPAAPPAPKKKKPAKKVKTQAEKDAEELAKSIESFFAKITAGAESAEKSTSGLVQSFYSTGKQSEKLSGKQWDLLEAYSEAEENAKDLGIALGGPEMQALWDSTTTEIERIERLRLQALKNEAAAAEAVEAASKQARVGKAAGVASDVLGAATGGGLEGLLGMAGPYGAAAGAAIGIGRGGAQAREGAVQDIAQERATKRQDAKSKEREALLKAGMSETRLEAMGLGASDIEQAGQVTAKDMDVARKLAPSTESFIAKQTEEMVNGLIEGAKGIILALPDILVELIPPLITEFIPALIGAIFKMIPKLIKAWVVDIIPAIARGIAQWWVGIAEWLSQLFKVGIGGGGSKGTRKAKSKQTGGFVPLTGQYLLHHGESVVPSGSAGTSAAKSGLAAFAPPSMTVNVSTTVLDNDAIPALGRRINEELGEFGRASFPVFNTAGG